MTSSRDRILARVRDQLRGAAASILATPAPRVIEGDLIARFMERLRAVAGECVDGERDATAAIADRLAKAGARTIAMGGGPEMDRLAVELRARGFTTLEAGATTDQIAQADAGVTAAQWGIAETGSIVLDDVVARARRASLLPPLHIALLPKANLIASLDAMLASTSERLPHALTLVTGPSRTADIELQLVVGVHGPRELCVVLR